jgi:hypothetical protein
VGGRAATDKYVGSGAYVMMATPPRRYEPQMGQDRIDHRVADELRDVVGEWFRRSPSSNTAAGPALPPQGHRHRLPSLLDGSILIRSKTSHCVDLLSDRDCPGCEAAE